MPEMDPELFTVPHREEMCYSELWLDVYSSSCMSTDYKYNGFFKNRVVHSGKSK